MVSIDSFKQLALGLPGTQQQPHFDKASFRINKTVIYPVDNKWGKQGWTLINLKKVRKDMLKDILTTAYTHVSTKKSN